MSPLYMGLVASGSMAERSIFVDALVEVHSCELVVLDDLKQDSCYMGWFLSVTHTG